MPDFYAAGFYDASRTEDLEELRRFSVSEQPQHRMGVVLNWHFAGSAANVHQSRYDGHKPALLPGYAEILSDLGRDETYVTIRKSLAEQHGNQLDDELIWRLAQDPSVTVRRALLNKPLLPIDVYFSKIEDDDWETRGNAQMRLTWEGVRIEDLQHLLEYLSSRPVGSLDAVERMVLMLGEQRVAELRRIYDEATNENVRIPASEVLAPLLG